MRITKTENEFDAVDIHAHVLPKADHGSASMKQTAIQLKTARDAGVTRIIATPHFYPHRHSVEHFLRRRNGSYRALCESGLLTSDMPGIRLGAEVLLFEGLEKMPDLRKLCIEGTEYILIEPPFSDLSDAHVDTVMRIIQQGMKVIIAHADRYDAKMVEEFVKAGAVLQLNASALCTFKRRDYLFDWIEKNFVIGIGSDIHGTSRTYYKNFIKAQRKIGSKIAYLSKCSDELWSQSTEYSFK